MNILALILMVILIALALSASFALTAGMFYLICLCFGLVFTWKVALGIWLLLILISSFISRK